MDKSFEQLAIKVSSVSIWGNILLSVFKFIAGIFAHSGAMVSDAVHSASDVISSIIVIIGVKASAKESDKNHQYGHERLESVAAIVLAMILLITGLFIGHTAIDVLSGKETGTYTVPGILAVIAALVSIFSKEAMYWYTRFYAKKLESDALMADAWHHRSDALSSIGSLIGVLGARMGHAWFDPLASIIICGFIIKAAYDIFSEAIRKLVDHACDEKIQLAIVECAKLQDGVIEVSAIRTREFGNRIYVDIEVMADGNMTLKESDNLAVRVHDCVERNFSQIKHIQVMVKPY